MQSYTATNSVLNGHTRDAGDLLEKVLIGNDLSSLSSLEKVQHIKNICNTIGLNPVTKPIQLMKFNGKEIPYFTKDATEQLRKINKVSIMNIDTKILDGGVYVVVAKASTPDGREDSSTGVIAISGLKGEALSNAMMKAETKAKRRVTLSICGLGFIDECEVESIPNARKMEVNYTESNKDIDSKFNYYMNYIKSCDSMDDLQEIFKLLKNENFNDHPDLFKKLINAKDEKKAALTWMDISKPENEVNSDTGEV